MFCFCGVRTLATSITIYIAILQFPIASTGNVVDDKYYKLLGVPITAPDAAIKKAYRQLALKWHPDKQSQKSDAEKKDAENKFKEISLAYDTLSDPEKRKVYDQVGEDGMKRGEKGHSFRSAGVDPFKIFEQFFGGGFGGGGGGGFSFNINLGGNPGRPGGLFADHADAIETLTDENKLRKLISESAAAGAGGELGHFVAILCIASNGDCKRLKQGLVKLGKSYKDVLSFYAMDCMSSPMLCRLVEPNVQRYPCIVYFGSGKRLPLGKAVESDDIFPAAEKITSHSVRTWLARVLPDSIVHITSKAEWDSFLSADSTKAKVALLTEKASVPPRLKSISMEYRDSLSIAFISKKVVPEFFDSSVLHGDLPPKAFPVFYDIQKNAFVEAAGDDLKTYLGGVVDAFQEQAFQSRTQIFELTWEMYDSEGVCSATDHKFCLLVIFPTRAELDVERRAQVFSQVNMDFKKERADPLRVHYIVTREETTTQNKLHAKLTNLLVAAGLVDTKETSFLLWRPKWKRFENFRGNVTCREEVLSFIQSTFLHVALDSIDGLSHEHVEL